MKFVDLYSILNKCTAMEVIDKKFLTIGETMAYLGCSRSYVYKLFELKKLTTYYVGKRTYIKREELEHLIETDKQPWQNLGK